MRDDSPESMHNTHSARRRTSLSAHPCESVLRLELLGRHQVVVDHPKTRAAATAKRNFEAIQKHTAGVLDLSSHDTIGTQARQSALMLAALRVICFHLELCNGLDERVVRRPFFTLYIFAIFSFRSFLETPARPGWITSTTCLTGES